ncbi:MAG: glycoside hydrolase family 99-like domain-containing protein [Actinomycetota bacterium]|nr:glycoside hydrolase family 99-like domain-containing protein [Actinomycetota bacterium]
MVVAHVHYPELWPDIDDRLARMPEEFDLVVTITEGEAESVIPNILRRHPHAHLEVCKNKGRDWAPLVELANKGLLSGYDAVAKVHTKKSEHRIDGDGWRLALLDGIFESPEQIRRTVDLLREDRSVGLVVPTSQVAGVEHWGSNRPLVEALAFRMQMAFEPDDLQFPAGSMFWCRPWLLERMADLCLDGADFEPEGGQYDATTAHALERLIGIFSSVAGMDIVEAMDVKTRLATVRRSSPARPKTLAFYLPQFHCTPENDEFWGAGFTDWVNVRKAKPLFPSHRQPILPNYTTGFYDLADPEVLRTQAELAKRYSLDGFIFHYYWFNGREVLKTPLENWLGDRSIELPLALCWANEPWTRRWDGLDGETLIPQDLTSGWESRFIESVAPFMRDTRYIQVQGKPLLLIYRVDLISDFAKSASMLRAQAIEQGLSGLHILVVQPSRDFGSLKSVALEASDGLVSFPPGSGVRLEHFSRLPALADNHRDDQFISYDSAARLSTIEGLGNAGKPVHPTIIPGWDNTARRGGDSYAFVGSNPVTFRQWAYRAAAAPAVRNSGLLFVNAWNEWAEGAVLEPSERFGDGMLAALKDSQLADES